jgi:hypothetical protein
LHACDIWVDFFRIRSKRRRSGTTSHNDEKNKAEHHQCVALDSPQLCAPTLASEEFRLHVPIHLPDSNQNNLERIFRVLSELQTSNNKKTPFQYEMGAYSQIAWQKTLFSGPAIHSKYGFVVLRPLIAQGFLLSEVAVCI